jgi:selenide,water dikinase
MALALERRVRDGGARPEVTIVEAAGRVVPAWSERGGRRVGAILTSRGIRRHGGRVVRVDPDAVVLDSGERIVAALVVWLTGAAPPAVVSDSPLPKDERGWFLVGATLRSADGAPVWGAGDCVALEGSPWVQKAGVYAVREAPVLAHNLRAAFTGGAQRTFRPQRSFLALVNTADGKALFYRPPFVAHARWAMRLKDRIDRAYVAGAIIGRKAGSR